MVLSEFSRQRKNYSDLPVPMSAYLSVEHYLCVFSVYAIINFQTFYLRIGNNYVR